MGRLPLKFAGKDITWRVPYTMPGEIDVAELTNGKVFPEATFLHNVDKPFEIHRMIVRIVAKGSVPGTDLATPQIFETQPDTLEERVKLRVTDLSKNENMTKSATLVSNLLAFNTGFWDWEEPYTIVRSEGFQVQIDTLEKPIWCILNTECKPENAVFTLFKVEVTFQGFLVVVAPPSETR